MAAYRTRLITPRDDRGGKSKGFDLLRSNVAAWWTDEMYDEGIYAVRAGRKTFYHLARPEFFKAVLLDQAAHFERSPIAKMLLGPAMGEGLLTSDGEQWRVQRRAVAPIFRAATLGQFLPAMDQIGCEAGRSMAACTGETKPVLPLTVEATLEVIVETIFGSADVDRAAVSRDVDIYLAVMGTLDYLDVLEIPRWVPRPWKWRGFRAVKRMKAQSRAALLDHRTRADGTNDVSLLDRLIAAKDPETGEALSDMLIVDNIMTFMGAGHETTAVALAWTLYLLAEQPDLQEEVLTELSHHLPAPDEPMDMESLGKLALTRRVLQEAMRLYPPIVAEVRNVKEAVDVPGLHLKTGDHVTLSAMPMHRNPAFFDDPDLFDANRFLPDNEAVRDRFSYMPFGGGPTVCVAHQFAMMEGVVLLARILQVCRFEATGDAPMPVVNVSLRPDNGIPLKIFAR